MKKKNNDLYQSKSDFITLLAVIFAALGLFAILTPIFYSFGPSKTAMDSLPRVDISSIGKGQYMISEQKCCKVFILKNDYDNFSVFSIPYDYKKKHYLMPDSKWMRAYMKCKNFGIDSKDNSFDKNNYFKCKDKENGLLQQWIWDISGVNISKESEDLPIPQHHLSDGELIFTGTYY